MCRVTKYQTILPFLFRKIATARQIAYRGRRTHCLISQLDRGADHARRRGWAVVATFKDDGYSAFKEITRDGFGELIAAIEGGRVDVVIVGISTG